LTFNEQEGIHFKPISVKWLF